MKFQKLSEFINYLEKNDMTISDVEIVMDSSSNINEKCNVCIDEEDVRTSEDDIPVKLEFLFDRPEYTAKIGDKDIMFFEDFEYTEGVCGRGRGIFDGHKFEMNICDYSDCIKAKLLIRLNENTIESREFELKKAKDDSDKAKIILKA